jgi:hypothetical protein
MESFVSTLIKFHFISQRSCVLSYNMEVGGGEEKREEEQREVNANETA